MGQRLIFSIVLCFLFGFGEFSQASQPCECALIHVSSMEGLFVYLQALIKEQVIGSPELERFIESLEKGKLENPITQEQARNTTYSIHRQGIDEHLEQSNLDLSQLLNWARGVQKGLKKDQVTREETRRDTADLYQRMAFQRVEPGAFIMGEGNKTVQVTLTHPIEVMSTPLTQKHWVNVMGENPSYFQDGLDSIILNINGKQVKLQPDHPVENVTWWSMIEFANRLSVLRGLQSAYDLSGLKYVAGTRAEDGTLNVESGTLKINAQDEDIYQAQGYRLPTEAEQEFLRRAGGKTTGKYPFPEKELKDYAWYKDNADGMTHAVAQLKAIFINGKAFYDLQGNVWEWGYDWQGDYSLTATINPCGSLEGSHRVVRGGGWNYDAVSARSAQRNGGHPQDYYEFVGARFVRTLP